MMKKISLISILLLCLGCKEREKPNVDDEILYIETFSTFGLEDYTEVEIDQYQVNEILFPLLDRAIDEVNSVPANRFLEQGYSLNISRKDGGITRISIHALERSNLDLFIRNGIFFYTGYRFMFTGVNDDCFFTHEGKFIHRIVKQELFTKFEPKEELGSWLYYYKDGKFQSVE